MGPYGWAYKASRGWVATAATAAEVFASLFFARVWDANTTGVTEVKKSVRKTVPRREQHTDKTRTQAQKKTWVVDIEGPGGPNKNSVSVCFQNTDLPSTRVLDVTLLVLCFHETLCKRTTKNNGP